MNIAILAAGDFPKKEFPLYLLRSAEVVVCCDSALKTALRHSLKVDAVVGDLDSVPARLLEEFRGETVKCSGQDDNDLTKALTYVMGKYTDIDSISFFGLSGKNEAHTLGNYALLCEYERLYGFWEKGIQVQAVSDYSTAFVITDSCTLDLGEKRTISFFTTDKELNIKSVGLEWPLDNVKFENLWIATRNRTTSYRIGLQLSHRSPVLVILD